MKFNPKRYISIKINSMYITRDALSLRYHRPLLKTPANCDGCGEEFSFQHALDCKKGGLVTQRHNEVRDVLGDLADIVYKDVVRKPIVQNADESSIREECGSHKLRHC